LFLYIFKPFQDMLHTKR